jgi:hypothetical protein
MDPLPWRVRVAVFIAATGFALILNQIKQLVTAAFKIE